MSVRERMAARMREQAPELDTEGAILGPLLDAVSASVNQTYADLERIAAPAHQEDWQWPRRDMRTMVDIARDLGVTPSPGETLARFRDRVYFVVVYRYARDEWVSGYEHVQGAWRGYAS